MKIAIQGHLTRGKDVIKILESLGGENGYDQSGSNEKFVYFINNIGFIYSVTQPMCSSERKIYTLEEFEKEFPFKIGDKIKHISSTGIIKEYCYINNEPAYKIESIELGIIVTIPVKMLELYKEMKKERNVKLTLEKAKEWYKKGGELKEIALQAFTEKELNPLPRSWEEFCANYPVKKGECWFESEDEILSATYDGNNRKHKNWIPSKESAEAHLAMIQLEQLRDCYNNSCDDTNRIAIINNNGNVQLYVDPPFDCFLTFKNHLLAREFFSNFKEIIEIAKELI